MPNYWMSSGTLKNYEHYRKTGTVPSVCEHGMHYIVNSKITLETLGRIQKYTDVQEIIWKHSGGPSSGPENLPFQCCHYR